MSLASNPNLNPLVLIAQSGGGAGTDGRLGGHPDPASGKATGFPADSGRTPVLSVAGVSKNFGHVRALTDVSFEAYAGEVTALFGDNGAGKSTLMKILCGAYQPDTGRIKVGDYASTGLTIQKAQEKGVQSVYQDLSLAPDLTVLENMFVGHEHYTRHWPRWLAVLDRRRMGLETRHALEQLSIDLPAVDIPVAKHSGGQRESVAVAR